MISKQLIEDTFIEMLSGIAEYKNDNEVRVKIGAVKNHFTIEFEGESSEAIVRSYYRNGQMRFKVRYKNYVRNGPYIEWSPDGNIIQEGNYFSGRRAGTFKFYSYDGKFKHEGQYLNGKRHGLWRMGRTKIYYSHGKVKKCTNEQDKWVLWP